MVDPISRNDNFDKWFNELIEENFFSEIDYKAVCFLKPDNVQVTKNDKYIVSLGFDDDKVKIHKVEEVSKDDVHDLHGEDVMK